LSCTPLFCCSICFKIKQIDCSIKTEAEIINSCQAAFDAVPQSNKKLVISKALNTKSYTLMLIKLCNTDWRRFNTILTFFITTIPVKFHQEAILHQWPRTSWSFIIKLVSTSPQQNITFQNNAGRFYCRQAVVRSARRQSHFTNCRLLVIRMCQ